MINDLTNTHDYTADDLNHGSNDLTPDYSHPNFELDSGTDNYSQEQPNLSDSGDLNSAHEHGYAQNYEEPYGHENSEPSYPQSQNEIDGSHNYSLNSSGYDTHSGLDAYQHDHSANHVSFQSSYESNDTVYHEHSGTVHHEHYWKKPMPYEVGGDTEHDKNTTYGESPEPISYSNNNSCVDNNNNSICDNVEAGNDSGCSSDGSNSSSSDN